MVFRLMPSSSSQFLPFIYLGKAGKHTLAPAPLTERERGFSATRKTTRLDFSSKEQELDPVKLSSTVIFLPLDSKLHLGQGFSGLLSLRASLQGTGKFLANLTARWFSLSTSTANFITLHPQREQIPTRSLPPCEKTQKPGSKAPKDSGFGEGGEGQGD